MESGPLIFVRRGVLVACACLAVLAIGFLCTSAAHTQQAADVTLTIGFADATNRFHVGQVIPLNLSFSASTPETYKLGTRGYDYSGRVGLDKFHVSPPGRDPLDNYFQGGAPFGFISGGLSGSSPYLGYRLQVIHENLNEWVALDHPGQYSIYVTSDRVTRRSGSKWRVVELRSNTLYLQIVPASPSWQAQVLESAESVLADPQSTAEEKHRALLKLRYLDSPASIQQLVRLLGDPHGTDSWDCMAGLFGSRYQPLVARDLEQNFSASDSAITDDYITALTATRVMLGKSDLPPYPASNRAEQKQWLARRQRRASEFRHVQDQLYSQAATLLGAKQGLARAMTVATVITWPGNSHAEEKRPVPLPGSVIANAFLSLSPHAEADLLTTYWRRIRVPEIVGALKSVLDKPFLADQQLRDLALFRLYEIDPGAAFTRIYQEIEHPHVDIVGTTVSIHTLGLLPDKSLPQLDAVLATRLAKKNSPTVFLDAQLIGRYATKAILPQVQAFYLRASGRWDCSIEDGLMTYFLRVDPPLAIRQLEANPSLCVSSVYRRVIATGHWRAVEPSLIRVLDGPDSIPAALAARILANYGHRRAQAALWNRLKVLHKQWAGHAAQLYSRPKMTPEEFDAVSLQLALLKGLATAQNWLLTNEQFSELQALAIGSGKQAVRQWRWKSPLTLTLSFNVHGRLWAWIDNIFLMNDFPSIYVKLAEFPPGTQLTIDTAGLPDRYASMIQTIEDAARQDGLVVRVDRTR